MQLPTIKCSAALLYGNVNGNGDVDDGQRAPYSVRKVCPTLCQGHLKNEGKICFALVVNEQEFRQILQDACASKFKIPAKSALKAHSGQTSSSCPLPSTD